MLMASKTEFHHAFSLRPQPAERRTPAAFKPNLASAEVGYSYPRKSEEPIYYTVRKN